MDEIVLPDIDTTNHPRHVLLAEPMARECADYFGRKAP